jgi:KaiC/GvpD/RAD55 family RecA-like ATPase/YHS domain-containing protein
MAETDAADRQAEAADGSSPDRQCDYCRLAIPEEPITHEHEGVTYHFCSEPCRETLTEEDRVFTEYHAARRFDPGVSALRAGLTQGIPRNSFVLVSGQPGTRDEALFGELVWRALQRGEPAVVATFLDTPVSLVQEFVALGWNVLPYLADGRLQVLDCFTYRLDDAGEMERSMSDWNRHLHGVAKRSTSTVRDPSNPQAVLNGLERCLDDVVDEDVEEGVAVIDSLTEFGSLVQPVQAYDFVKDLRASIPKARTVPVFAGASRVNEGTDFPHDLGYIADGVIDLTLSDELVEDALMKRIRVRKMSGVRSISRWATYEFAESRGLVAARPSDAEDEEGSDGAGDEDGGDDGQGVDGRSEDVDAEGDGSERGDDAAVEPPKTDGDVAPEGDPAEGSE